MKKTDPISAAKSYQMALQAISKTQTKHEAIKRAVDALDVIFELPDEATPVNVESGFGYHTKVGFVVVTIGESAVQLDLVTARLIAMQILEAADAAESDGFLLSWLALDTDLAESQVASLLHHFREYREKTRHANVQPSA